MEVIISLIYVTSERNDRELIRDEDGGLGGMEVCELAGMLKLYRCC